AVLASCFWPISAWFTTAALRGTPAELEETARLELAGPAAAAFASRPYRRVAAGAAALLVFLLCFADFGVPNALGVATLPRALVESGGAAASSVRLGALTAAACVAAAYLLGAARPVQLALTLPYAFPGSLVAIAAIAILNRPGILGELYGTEGALLWVYVVL